MIRSKRLGMSWSFANLALAAALGLTASAASAEDFYQGKELRIVVGSDTGGGYDAYARILAQYWSKYIPGHPQIIVQNMPGAGSLAAMNYIANVAAKDGLTVGAMQNSIGYEPMMGISGGKENDHFDVLKMNWVGSMSKEVAITILWNPPPVHSLQEMIDTKKEVTTGSSGSSTSNTIFARLMNSILGTHFNVVHGYPSQAPIWLAMERGEVQGSAGPFYSSLENSKPDWLRDKKITILVQAALDKHPDLPDVPLLLDFAKAPQDRQEMELAVASLSMGRPFVLPGGVPPDRVKILSDSFMAAMKDPDLIRDSNKEHLEINAIDGTAVHKILADMYATPQPIIDKVTAIMVPKDQ
jgi:tripartite-type tricarboxylate transporter receptor subunit TctC